MSRSAFTAAKEFLTRTLDDFEDFSSLASFFERFPDAADNNELSRAGNEFKEFCRDYADLRERDPSVLRDIADEITTVGEKLDVNVSQWAEPLWERADEIDAERESDEPESTESERGWFENSKALTDVDLMFGGLLHEITERAS